MIPILLCAAAGYLCGSVSFAYLLGRRHGVDLRRSGSGNLGSTNVYEHYGRAAGLLVLALDFLKAFVPAMLALHLAGREAAAAAGAAAIAGHNWSVFLRFTGGRGLICSAGAMLVLSPPVSLLVTAIMLSGYAFRNPALSTVAAALSAPALAILLHADRPMVLLATAVCLLTFAKRLHANGAPFPAGSNPIEVIWLRLLFDRDIRDDRAWQDRRSTRRDSR